MLKKIIRHFKGDDLQYPFYNILGRGVHAFYFSTGGNNLLVSVICECVTVEDCRLEFQGTKLTLINSRDFNGLPDRIIRCKGEEGEEISFFFPAMDGHNKTCCVIINGIHYPAMIEKLA